MKEGRKRKERGLLAYSSCPIHSAWAQLCPLCQVLHSLPTVGWLNGVQDRAGVGDLGVSQVLRAEARGSGDGQWQRTAVLGCGPSGAGRIHITLNCKLLLIQADLFFPCCHVYSPSLSYTRADVNLTWCTKFREIIFFLDFSPFFPPRISFLLIPIPTSARIGAGEIEAETQELGGGRGGLVGPLSLAAVVS